MSTPAKQGTKEAESEAWTPLSPVPVNVETGGVSAPGTVAKPIPGGNRWYGQHAVMGNKPSTITSLNSLVEKKTASVSALAPEGTTAPLTPMPVPPPHKSLLSPGGNASGIPFNLDPPDENASEGGSRRRTFKKSRKARKTKSRKFRQRGGFTNSRLAFQPVQTRKYRVRPVGNIPVEVTEGNSSIIPNYVKQSLTMNSTDRRMSIISAPSTVSKINPITLGVRRQSEQYIIPGSKLSRNIVQSTQKTPRQSLASLQQLDLVQDSVSPSILESNNGPSTGLEAQMNPTQGGKRTKKSRKATKSKKVTRSRKVTKASRKAKNQR